MNKELIKKQDFILEKCKGKKILDLGCIDHNLYNEKIMINKWLHNRIKNVADSIIGVDLLEEMIPKLNKNGFNIVYGNVEELESISDIKNETYDLIIAGDLIEHLFNVGKFLSSVKSFFHAETELIITTPNCFSSSFVSPFYFRGYEKVREDHTCWYSEKTLIQLLKMNDFEIKEFNYSSEKIINGIRPFFGVMFRRFFPRFCEGMIVVVKLRN